jgi:beta-carotene hydroxylase
MIEDEAQAEIFLPTISMLGNDLVAVTKSQQIWTLVKPLLCTLAYVVFAILGLWPLAVLAIVFLTFNTFVSSSHDLVHMSLGLPRRVNDRWLTVIELLSLRSGHAFRTCHWNHHQHFPDWQDIEGWAVHCGLLRTLAEGPIYQIKLYRWALGHAKPADRKIIVAEGIAVLILAAICVAVWPLTPIPAIYAGLVTVLAWVYPLATVYVPHVVAEHKLFQTRAFRGPIVSFLFAKHNYHLEHHLYPTVPHQHWAKLGERLEPYFEKNGVKPIRF